MARPEDDHPVIDVLAFRKLEDNNAGLQKELDRLNTLQDRWDQMEADVRESQAAQGRAEDRMRALELERQHEIKVFEDKTKALEARARTVEEDGARSRFILDSAKARDDAKTEMERKLEHALQQLEETQTQLHEASADRDSARRALREQTMTAESAKRNRRLDAEFSQTRIAALEEQLATTKEQLEYSQRSTQSIEGLPSPPSMQFSFERDPFSLNGSSLDLHVDNSLENGYHEDGESKRKSKDKLKDWMDASSWRRFKKEQPL